MSPDKTPYHFTIFMVEETLQTFLDPIAPSLPPDVNDRLKCRSFLKWERNSPMEYGGCYWIQFRGQCAATIPRSFKGNRPAPSEQIQNYGRFLC